MRTQDALQPIRRILVGQRPNGRNTAPIETAIAIAHSLGASLRVVRVESAHPLLLQLGLESYADLDRARPETQLSPEELADRAGFSADRLEVKTVRGRARTLLLEEAHKWGADLVVIGPASPETLPRMVLGSVTDNLVRNLRCPLMVADDPGAFPPKHVLFPVDLSTVSGDALACGLSFLRQTLEGAGDHQDSRPTHQALLVIPETPVLATAHEADEVAAVARRELERWLREAVDEGDRLAAQVLRGSVAATIVRTAKTDAVDLIIMGTHGHGAGPIQRQLVGSVVAPVLVDPPTNILMIPPPTQLGAELADAIHEQTAPDFPPGPL